MRKLKTTIFVMLFLAGIFLSAASFWTPAQAACTPSTTCTFEVQSDRCLTTYCYYCNDYYTRCCKTQSGFCYDTGQPVTFNYCDSTCPLGLDDE